MGGAEREPDADFRVSLPGEMCHHAVQADGSEQQRRASEQADECGHHALWGDGLVEDAAKSLRTDDDDT